MRRRNVRCWLPIGTARVRSAENRGIADQTRGIIDDSWRSGPIPHQYRANRAMMPKAKHGRKAYIWSRIWGAKLTPNFGPARRVFGLGSRLLRYSAARYTSWREALERRRHSRGSRAVNGSQMIGFVKRSNGQNEALSMPSSVAALLSSAWPARDRAQRWLSNDHRMEDRAALHLRPRICQERQGGPDGGRACGLPQVGSATAGI